MKINEKATEGYVKVKSILDKVRDDERGMGTIEILLIIAVLIALAFLFNGFIVKFFGTLTDGIKGGTDIGDIIK